RAERQRLSDPERSQRREARVVEYAPNRYGVAAHLDADDDGLLADGVYHAERIAFFGDQDAGRDAQQFDRFLAAAFDRARLLDIDGQRGTVKDWNRGDLHGE